VRETRSLLVIYGGEMEQAAEAKDPASVMATIEARSVKTPHPIPVELMSGNSRAIKVVNNQNDDLKFAMRDEDLEIKLTRPVFVSTIALNLGSFDNVKGMKLVAADLLSGKVEKKSILVENTSGANVRFILNSVITSFILHRGSYFSKDIKKITVDGLFLSEMETFERDYKDIGSLKKEALDLIKVSIAELEEKGDSIKIQREKLESQTQEVQKLVAALNEERDGLREQLDVLKDETNDLTGRLASLKANEVVRAEKLGELEKRSIGIESELEQKTQTLSSTNIAISKAEEKLKGLVSNVNVFTEEFSGFVEQGRKQVNMYAGLSAVPLFLLTIVVYNLFRGAVDLSTKFQEMPRIDLLTLVVTRLPFVAVASLLIGVSVKILFFFVNRIIAIHQQRLDLAKIALIAKDVSDASAAQLNMTSTEIYEAKTYLKMMMLRAYLSDQFDKFTYSRRDVEELKHAEESAVEKVEVPST
jgi:hypothetical protein